ncbi:YebC/PmpR family DNA-binding transcriptional regulator, partial [Parvimonas sp. M20]|uniref:YebC/PmpR family DNA-binding transcriptional regulator n=1 Tax=Parvimonas sp. M20 TaxID=3110693 RepID=UPI002B46CCBF
HAFDKHGGNLGKNVSVLFMFEKKGVILISRDQAEEDYLMDFALENGASDYESDEVVYTIYSEVSDFITLRDELQEQ